MQPANNQLKEDIAWLKDFYPSIPDNQILTTVISAGGNLLQALTILNQHTQQTQPESTTPKAGSTTLQPTTLSNPESTTNLPTGSTSNDPKVGKCWELVYFRLH